MAHYLFISANHQRHSKLALFTFILAFVVILLGAYTRLTNAGLSCPDWPNCYGFLTAPHTEAQIQIAAQKYPATPVNVKKAWTEMTHRYAAGIEGILILILAFSIFLSHKAREFKMTLIAGGLILLLAVQVLLGMLTVTEQLKPVIVLAHLVTGLSILSLLWWAYLQSSSQTTFSKPSTSSALMPWLWIGFIIVALQITLGGWVSTHYAGLVCIDFPYCHGQLLPHLQWNHLSSDMVTIHMLHRIGAVITALYLSGLALFLLTRPSFKAIGLLIVALIALQLTLGILNIIWLRPVWLALIHHSVAIFLLLTLITALVRASSQSQDNRYASRFA